MKKIRIGNDFVFNWAIERGGLPENLESVLDAKLKVSVFGKKKDVPFTVSGNIITIEFTPEICNIIGSYNLLFTYILPDTVLSDEERKCAVDVDAFQIVSKTAQADDSTEFSITSDMAIAFKGDKGDSAYKVWLEEGNTGTEEDYFAYLRQPAIDAGASISELEGEIQVSEGLRVQAESSRQTAESLRVDAELLRQTNTQIAITNAEGATLNANNAATNANDAREAIQSDLGVKAFHGYASIEVAKTLKEVEDDTSVKMTNLFRNSSFENGATTPIVTQDGGGGLSTLSLNTINPISGNYDARFQVITPATHSNRPLMRLSGLSNEWVLNHVFYFGMSVRINSGTPIIQGAFNGVRVAELNLTLKDGFNSWTIECIGLNSFALIYLDGRTIWDFNFDNLIAYDLTAIFGAGNEPTKEEMDLLISTLGINYFEGEITIPAQKVMQWQLKMIRQNRSAIIALGGTII